MQEETMTDVRKGTGKQEESMTDVRKVTGKQKSGNFLIYNLSTSRLRFYPRGEAGIPRCIALGTYPADSKYLHAIEGNLNSRSHCKLNAQFVSDGSL
jgi:hypothetical protein